MKKKIQLLLHRRLFQNKIASSLLQTLLLQPLLPPVLFLLGNIQKYSVVVHLTIVKLKFLKVMFKIMFKLLNRIVLTIIVLLTLIYDPILSLQHHHHHYPPIRFHPINLSGIRGICFLIKYDVGK